MFFWWEFYFISTCDPPEEIIVITLDNKNSEVEFASLRSMLNQLSIKCTTPGYVESSDKFKEAGRVTLTTPFRAKGNEANIVFVIHCEKVINDYSGSFLSGNVKTN